MYDPMASFYGGYDRTNLTRRPLLRVRWVQIGIGLAVIMLVGFLAADAYAIAASPRTVDVTDVTWTTSGTTLASAAGFTIHGGATFTESLTCASVCYRFTGATVNSPFAVVAFATEIHPIQFTNVTIRAPSSGYSGPLEISLSLPAPSSVDPALG
jgi:hypothetical protein